VVRHWDVLWTGRVRRKPEWMACQSRIDEEQRFQTIDDAFRVLRAAIW